MAYHPFRHLPLKVTAVMLATLLWLVVAGDPIVERALRVPLEFQNIPERLELVGEPLGTVDVRVRGASGLVGRLEPGEVVAVLDLKGARAGRRLFHLATDQVRVPFGVEVAAVLPTTVALELEPSAARHVPVTPQIEGAPAPGYVIARVTSDPTAVEVVGPERHLKELTEAITDPVSVANATEPVNEVVTIGVADAALRLREPRTARVTVEIVPAPIARTLYDVPVRMRNLSPTLSAQVVPPSVTVSARGPRDVLNRLQTDVIMTFVDLAGLGAGRYYLPVRADTPTDFGVSRIEPEAVEVRIK